MQQNIRGGWRIKETEPRRSVKERGLKVSDNGKILKRGKMLGD